MATRVAELGRHSSRLKELARALRSRPAGDVVVEGWRLLADLVRWGTPVRELYLSADAVDDPRSRGLIQAASQAWQVAGSVFERVAPSRSPQGVVAIVDEPRVARWDFSQGVGLYLEGVQDPGNVGAVIRSAAGLGARTVLLSPGCADPMHWAAVRASAGAVFRIPVLRDVDLDEAAGAVRSARGQVLATAGGGPDVAAFEPAPPILLLLGSEGRGLSPESRRCADATISIPLRCGLDSLNVAVAAAVLLSQLGDGL